VIKIYNSVALLTLLYDSENWTLKAKDKTEITAAGMRFRRTKVEMHSEKKC